MSKSYGKTLALLGAWLQLAPLLGLIGTVGAMIATFGRAANGEPTAEGLAVDIWQSMIVTAGGIVLGFMGMIFIAVALFHCRYREPWFFAFLVVISFVWMLYFPIGTVIGVLMLYYLILRHDEFKPKGGERRYS